MPLREEELGLLQINKQGWDKVADQFFEGTFETLDYGPYAPAEEELKLFGDIRNQVGKKPLSPPLAVLEASLLIIWSRTVLITLWAGPEIAGLTAAETSRSRRHGLFE